VYSMRAVRLYVCPTLPLEAFLLDEEEVKRAPESFKTKKAVGKGLGHLQYRVQLSPLDCTGCGNCADVCPAPDKALVMQPAAEMIEKRRTTGNLP
jgi:pyruvate-ferredoxin/flavodoxin oxidoreductase